MEEVNIRVECLKLAHRHDRGPEAVLNLAKEYEAYVLGTKPDKLNDPLPQARQDHKSKTKSGQGN